MEESGGGVLGGRCIFFLSCSMALRDDDFVLCMPLTSISRLRSHIESNCTSTVLQSAYKEFHSTETVLLKVHNG